VQQESVFHNYILKKYNMKSKSATSTAKHRNGKWRKKTNAEKGRNFPLM